jgi:hypothetical protein
LHDPWISVTQLEFGLGGVMTEHWYRGLTRSECSLTDKLENALQLWMIMGTPREFSLSGPSFDNIPADDELFDVCSTTPPAWRAVLDEASGDTYYWDPSSGVTCWDPRFATMPEEEVSFHLDLADSKNSFASGKVTASWPNNDKSSTQSTKTPAKTAQQTFEQVNPNSIEPY